MLTVMSGRSQKLSTTIKRELSSLIPTLKDPRVPLVVTVEEVNVSSDSRRAKVLVSTLNDDDVEEMLIALNKAKGYLQHELAENLGLRYTPVLSFHNDALEVLR